MIADFPHYRHTVGSMIAILSMLVSQLSFRVRSCVSLELELIGLRHQLILSQAAAPPATFGSS
jgi:hypothetical protein